MAGKGLTALITVVIGIGAALLLFYVLNKFAELLPAKWEERIKPLLYILPAFLAIVVYLVYPTILTFINAFKDRSSTEWVGFQNFEDLLTDPGFQDTIFNTLLWMLVVPASCVVLGLAVATLADRLGPRGEKTSKTIIFLPMAISMVGAATIWRFVFVRRGDLGTFNPDDLSDVPGSRRWCGHRNSVGRAVSGAMLLHLLRRHRRGINLLTVSAGTC